jgi:hypothetical protein
VVTTKASASTIHYLPSRSHLTSSETSTTLRVTFPIIHYYITTIIANMGRGGYN